MILHDGHIKVLKALFETTTPGEHCVPFAVIMELTSMRRDEVRRCCRYLRHRELTEYHSGLWTEEGTPAGSGYCITYQGREELKRRTERDDARRVADIRGLELHQEGSAPVSREQEQVASCHEEADQETRRDT